MARDDETAEHPRDAAELEPDYRFTLANERTFLAWERTALGLLAAAVAVIQLVPQLGVPAARHIMGVGLVLLAMIAAGAGLRRWQLVERAIRRGDPLPRNAAPVFLGAGLVLLGVVVLALVLIKAFVR